jgi:predicted dehydrogenase
MVAKVKVGFIGTGNIAPAYIRHSQPYEILDLVACADLDHGRAQAFAAEHGLRAMTVAELLADPEIEIVLNLTIPRAHAEVSLLAIEAGKHVYAEKPFAVTREDGRKVIEAAKAKGVLTGCAPDTFLGGGAQTARKLIDEGVIGQPVAATAFMVSHGPESWHPNPFFYYDVGGGPMFDMGPYYLTGLVNLLGPITRVTGSTRASFPERIATSQQWNGTKVPVHTTTHLTGTLDFASGAIGTIVMSFDVWAHRLPIIEIYGSEGTLIVPDPNTFGGEVRLWTPRGDDWRVIPHSHPTEIGRGTGVADMAYAIRGGRAHRASGELAYHVLDVMAAFDEASQDEKHVHIASAAATAQPAPLPAGLPVGVLDA